MSEISDRSQLQLNRLYLLANRLSRDLPDPADFWPEFACAADAVLDDASPDEFDLVAAQIDRILVDKGLRSLPQD